MECPFCAETIKDEAVVCKHCNRDLRVALPVIAEIQETVLELDRLQRQLDRVNTSLALFDRPARFLFLNGGIYVLLPSLLLLAAHYLVTVAMNVSPLYLRIASVIIPMPFGMAAYALTKAGARVVMLEAGASWFASRDSKMMVPSYATPHRGAAIHGRPRNGRGRRRFAIQPIAPRAIVGGVATSNAERPAWCAPITNPSGRHVKSRAKYTVPRRPWLDRARLGARRARKPTTSSPVPSAAWTTMTAVYTIRNIASDSDYCNR